ncbi:MAG: sigma 54-interacting transcriptional regulator [Eubacteriaceae bacterium]|nr:sigma 54-interacting transcriptional regulator [Eubacteriaceae bacterium]
MKEKLLQLIKDEDKKNPFTDEQLSELLAMNRSNITLLRSKLEIPDSRVRRMPILIPEIQGIIDDREKISIADITEELRSRGFKISKNSVNRLITDKKLKYKKNNTSTPIQPVSSTERKSHAVIKANEEEVNPFASIIGWNGSLRNKIEQAKASVLYPPNGLHTLIVGATGVGKSYLAEAMYKFALSIKNISPEKFPFIVFNCADYSENPQLLLSQLFGYKKGAFTGADADKEGLVDQASGGILFLDEVHRLPHDGQEILFQLIDKNRFRRLGETSLTHEAKVMIIAATSEDIETNLLTTFRRRIPMVIELPALSDRNLKERYQIIKKFFENESVRINKPLIIKSSTLRNLLIYKCTGNIGQLRSDIQVACARGLLSYMTSGSSNEGILIDTKFLPSHVSLNMINTQWSRTDIEKIVRNDMVLNPGNLFSENLIQEEDDIYHFQEDIYKYIEDQYYFHKKEGYPDEDISNFVSETLEKKIEKMIDDVNRNKYQFKKIDLDSIVGHEIVQVVQKIMLIAQDEIGEVDDTLYYCLATHLNATLQRIRNGQNIINPKLNHIMENNAKEFAVAKKMASLISSELSVNISDDETAFIAMYILNFTKNKTKSTKKVGVIVMSHGNVAEGMANVANTLLSIDHVNFVEMALDEKPDSAYERALNAVVQSDNGKGVIILADMGSLEGFGESITRETGIKTMTVGRVDTLMVLNATRMALLPDADLEYITNTLLEEKTFKNRNDCKEIANNDKSLAIVCVCFTGEGTARYVQNLIKDEILLIDKKIKVVSMSFIDSDRIEDRITRLMGTMNILAVVGTVGVDLPGIPFAYASDVIKVGGLKSFVEKVKLSYRDIARSKYIPDGREDSNSLFRNEFIFMDKNIESKNDAIKFLCDELSSKGFIKENYLEGVLEREELCPTYTESQLAIPHGYCEDVIKSTIGILIPQKPIDWGNGREVSLILLLALNDEMKDEFQWIYKIITDRKIVNQINNSKSSDEIMQIFNKKREEKVG